jgi:hypothetical protein
MQQSAPIQSAQFSRAAKPILAPVNTQFLARRYHQHQGAVFDERSQITAVPAVMQYNKKRKYHSVVKTNESIFGRAPRKNSDSTLGRKDVNQESSHQVYC